MKKKLIIVLCIVVALVGVLIWLRPEPRPATFHEAAVSQKTPEVETPVVRPVPAKLPDDKLAREEKLRESYKRIDESMARLDKIITPEMRERIRTSRLARVRTDYEAYFLSLQVDPDDARHALDIILEKESKMMDAQEALQRTGFTNGRQDYSQNRRTEDALAEVQLQNLLGEQGYADLLAYEAKRQSEISARVKKIMSKHQDD